MPPCRRPSTNLLGAVAQSAFSPDIGSAQKKLQVAPALKLVEDQLISLDDPLGKWLPAYPNINGKMTIRQLLNLTSGVDNLVEDPNYPWRVEYGNIRFEKQ